MSLPSIGGAAIGSTTQNAGTVITAILPGRRGCYSYLTFIRYTAAATAHTVLMMRSASRAVAAAAAAAAANSVTYTGTLTDGGGNAIAANDYVGYELAAGKWQLDKVAAVNTTTKVITLTGTLDAALPAGAAIVCFGAPGDSYHTGSYGLTAALNTTTNYPAIAGNILLRSTFRNDPIMLYSANATNAGTLEGASVEHCRT